MRRDKILINISDLNDLEKFEKLGVSNFLFPLEDFSIGYKAFSFEEIGSTSIKAYVLVNRLLTDEDIDHFLQLEIPENVVGFVIEDTGLMYELKDSKYELINFQNHLNNNYETINYWLNYFDSVVLSTDITKEEVEKILGMAKKPLVICSFLYPMVMYSRRDLVANYRHHNGKTGPEMVDVSLDNPEISFKFVGSKWGTAVFDCKILDVRDALKDIDDENIKFYLIDTNFLDTEKVIKAIKGEEIEDTHDGFFSKKTIYKVGDIR